MKIKYCEDCKFFFQHYVKIKDKYSAAGCGHCIALRVKRCAPEKAACKHFLEKDEL